MNKEIKKIPEPIINLYISFVRVALENNYLEENDLQELVKKALNNINKERTSPKGDKI